MIVGYKNYKNTRLNIQIANTCSSAVSALTVISDVIVVVIIVIICVVATRITFTQRPLPLLDARRLFRRGHVKAVELFHPPPASQRLANGGVGTLDGEDFLALQKIQFLR